MCVAAHKGQDKGLRLATNVYVVSIILAIDLQGSPNQKTGAVLEELNSTGSLGGPRVMQIALRVDF